MSRNDCYATIRVGEDETVYLTIWRREGDRKVQVDSAPFWGDYEACRGWCQAIGYEVEKMDDE